MTTVTISEAEKSFCQLLDRAGKGEEIIILKSGKPLVRLGPADEKLKRVPGSAKGKIIISKDFNDPLPDSFLEAFEK